MKRMLARHVHAEFEAEGAAALWDPWTGHGCGDGRHLGARVSWAGDRSFGLEPFGSALIVFDPEDRGAAAADGASGPAR
jgi:hypothetical protein